MEVTCTRREGAMQGLQFKWIYVISAVCAFVMILQTAWTTDIECPPCRCQIVYSYEYQYQRIDMNCTDLKLKKFPDPPNRSRRMMTRIILDFNHFPSLNQSQLEKYTHYRIYGLSMKRTGLVNISKDAFCKMKSMGELDLSQNIIPEKILKGALTGVRSNRLILSSMGLWNISDDFFEHLPSKNLNLTFENNTNNMFPAKAFMRSKNLFYLDFGYNNLKQAYFCNLSFPSVRHLKLDNNLLDEFPDFCCIGQAHLPFPNLTHLSFQWNSIKVFNRESYSCLKKLRYFHLNGNLLNKLETNQFALLPSLFELKLSYIGCAIRNRNTIQRAVFNNTSLKKIFFRQNNIWFRKEEVDMRMFEGCTNLELLNLNQNMFQKSEEDDFTLLLRDLKSLEILIMTDCQLTWIPKVITEHLTNLTSLALYNNFITGWKEHTFDNLTQLTHLFMSGNKISSITEKSFPKHFVQHAKEVELNQNDFACSCELLWFINWLKSNPKVFEFITDKYICSSEGPFEGQKLVKVRLSKITCIMGMEMKITTLTCSIILIVMFVVGAVLYRYRWQIRYIIFMIRYSQRQETDTKSYEYDVFVAYSTEDRYWVIKTLLPILEGKESLKLCIHDRDFEVGKLIVDNIVDGIESSRKILIVLSNTFAQSNWCQFEMNLIQRHVLENRKNLLVVILLEDIESRNMTKVLKAMLETTTYLLWAQEDYAVQAFFNRLRMLLRRPMIHERERRSSL